MAAVKIEVIGDSHVRLIVLGLIVVAWSEGMSQGMLGEYTEEQAVEILYDVDRHDEIDEQNLPNFLYFGIHNYGTTNDSTLIQPLIALYAIVAKNVDRDVRDAIYQAVVPSVESHELSVNALLPFLYEESDKAISSRAVIDYVMFRPVTDEEPMAGVSDVIEMLKGARGENSGAILAGLLLTGDRRVLELISAHVPSLSTRDVIDEFVHVHSGYTYSALVDFYLSWLDELNRRQMDDEFGALAAGLVNILKYDQFGMVFEVERNFGLQEGRDPMQLVLQETFSEYFARSKLKMLELADRERSPRVMPSVVDAWEKHIRAL